jgi:hypothetical protein
VLDHHGRRLRRLAVAHLRSVRRRLLLERLVVANCGGAGA